MQPSELAFFTTEELITELVRRKTFLGVIIQAEEERKDARWSAEKIFKVHLNENLAPPQATRLLETVAEYMDQHHC